MIDKISTLFNKTTELEENIINLSEKENISNKKNGCVCFNKNFINYSVLTKQKVQIARFEAKQNESLYFQAMIELNISTAQKVTFSLIANDISIYKSTKNLPIGFNQITLMKSYTPLTSEPVDVFLEITPLNQKLVSLEDVSLAVWGLATNNDVVKYQVLELENKFLLSYISNETLYYLKTEKQVSINNSEDFNVFKSAKSFSFAYLKVTNQLFLFRVDTAGRLFFCDFENKNEKFIDFDINSVSSSTDGNMIVLTYIKNGLCYYFEYENGAFSNTKQLNCVSKNLTSVYCYFNKYSNKFYVIISDADGSNFFVESYNEFKTFGENINAKILLSISTYDGDLNI